MDVLVGTDFFSVEVVTLHGLVTYYSILKFLNETNKKDGRFVSNNRTLDLDSSQSFIVLLHGTPPKKKIRA